jgi:hypothetical protein
LQRSSPTCILGAERADREKVLDRAADGFRSGSKPTMAKPSPRTAVAFSREQLGA